MVNTMAGATAANQRELSQADMWLRQGFKYGNKLMLLIWRLGLQRWGMSNPYLGYIMVLTHTGRKSGRRRQTPLNFAEIDGDLYCVAGFGALADWHRNVLADPCVEVWLPDGSWWAGKAADVTELPHEDKLPLLRQVLINSGFAAYAAGLTPRTMSESELEAATRAYRLVRVRRTEARTGQGGPSDLAWVWPWVAAGMVLLALGRRAAPRSVHRG